MARLILLAALVAGFIVAVPSAAQVGNGNGKIAYTIGVIGSPHEGDGLYTVNANGSARTLLKAGNGLSAPRWSPDGSRVAFTHLYSEGSWPRYRLLVMDADGRNERLVATGTGSIALSRQPWAPDGSRIAWTAAVLDVNVTRTDVYTADASGGDIRQLTFDGVDKDPPSWSPTGSMLVYSRIRQAVGEYPWELIVVDADGSGSTQITAEHRDRNPTWSPSGEWIAFVRLDGTNVGIYIVHPDGTGLQRVCECGPQEGGPQEVTWSPDGTKFAYGLFYQTGRFDYKFEIWVVGAEGGSPKLVAESGSNPVWSPDGARILFLGPRGLTTMNADGTCKVEVSEDQLTFDQRSPPASWQPAPGGPNLGRVHCHAMAVDVESVANKPAAVLVNAAVVNEGTEPLTHVTLVATAPGNLSPAIAQLHRAGCSFRTRQVTCRLSRLEPGARRSYSLRFGARRVPIWPRGAEAGNRIGLNVSAAEPLLPTRRESEVLEFRIVRCTTRDEGAGRISGTPFADRICGRRGTDYIRPGRGADVVQAGGGNDVINAVDSRSDTDRISCGRGRDRVIADRRDRVSPDCERVIRRKRHS